MDLIDGLCLSWADRWWVQFKLVPQILMVNLSLWRRYLYILSYAKQCKLLKIKQNTNINDLCEWMWYKYVMRIQNICLLNVNEMIMLITNTKYMCDDEGNEIYCYAQRLVLLLLSKYVFCRNVDATDKIITMIS